MQGQALAVERASGSVVEACVWLRRRPLWKSRPPLVGGLCEPEELSPKDGSRAPPVLPLEVFVDRHGPGMLTRSALGPGW